MTQRAACRECQSIWRAASAAARAQVEEALLFGGGGARDAAAEPERKRRRPAAQPAADPAVGASERSWAALCDLYSRLGEEHLAQVAQAAHVARRAPPPWPWGPRACSLSRGGAPLRRSVYEGWGVGGAPTRQLPPAPPVACSPMVYSNDMKHFRRKAGRSLQATCWDLSTCRHLLEPLVTACAGALGPSRRQPPLRATRRKRPSPCTSR